MAACSVRSLSVLLFLAIACLGCSKTTASSNAPPASAAQTSAAQAPAAVVPPKVQIDKVYLARSGGNTPADTQYKIISNLKNNGPGIASVDGSCSWTCPGSSFADAGSPQAFKGVQLSVSWEQGLQGWTATPICAGAIPSVQFSCNYHVQGVDAARKPAGPVQTLNWQGMLPLPK